MSEEKNREKEEQTTPETHVAESNSEKKPEESVEEKKETPAEAEVKETEEKEAEAEKVKVAHDDFDWEGGNLEQTNYSEEEFKRMEEEYAKTITELNAHQIVTGVIESISDRDVFLDFNSKSNGIVSLNEFKNKEDLKAGEKVEVFIEKVEDDRGQLVLSRRKARLLQAWDMIVDSYKNDTVIEGTVVSKTKGGLIANCNGLETFLPGSQIDINPIVDYDAYVGKTLQLKVVKINEAIKNAVVSHKALIENHLAEQRESIISSLEKGQVLEGTVKNITDFGAFMDLGGVDGLLYITDISWGRINHPSEVLELQQKVNVVVLDFDEAKKRISLGLKQLTKHPWDELAETLSEGSVVKGKIVNIEDYGAFLEIKPGVEGLIHVSEVSWSNQPINAKQHFNIGDECEAKIVTLDKEDRKMSLSIKQLSKDPWDLIGDKYPVGSTHKGEVKNLTPYGVFVEMEEGIGGMVHISDLSWTKRYSHPSEFTSVGKDIEVVILDIDKEDRKLSLGHKQLEENPWDTFVKVFPVGSYHEATIIRKDDRGAIVQLPYGLEAFCPIRHIKKEDGKMAEVDETLTFKVIEFNRDDKRIMVSHLRYLDDIKREADKEVRKEKQKQRKQTKQAIKSQRSKLEKTTLGELAAFSQLKNQLTDSDKEEQKGSSEEE